MNRPLPARAPDARGDGSALDTASEAPQARRGMVAPPELSDSDREGLTRVVTEMHESQAWKDALAKNGWEDSFQVGEEFDSFLAQEQTRVNGILADLGLAG